MKRRAFLKSSLLALTAVGLGVPSFLQGAKSTKKGQKMKIAVLAASGKAGRLITDEALNRGYAVSAFVRNAKKLAPKANLSIVQKDIFTLESKDLQGFDIIIDAFGEWGDLSLYKKHAEHLVKILQANSAKFLVVGGAGSLYMDKAHTTMLMDTPTFPDAHKGVAKAHGEILALLRQQKAINWVYVSPAADFDFKGEKTGKYKVAGEEFETNANGESKVSYADYASAMLDIAADTKINKIRVSVIGL